MSSNIPTNAKPQTAPASATIAKPVTVKLAPYVNAKPAPMTDSTLMIHNRQSGASWFTMKFRDQDSMLKYAEKYNRRDSDLYGLPYDSEACGL